MIRPKTTAHAADEGTVLLDLQGARIVAKLRSEEVGGACSLVEYTVPPGLAGPPPHRHEETSESFYVVEGAVTMVLDGEEHELTTGSFLLVPPGVGHTFRNRSHAASKLLILMTPGGFERYFEELAALIEREGGTWPLPDMGKLASLQSRYDMVAS